MGIAALVAWVLTAGGGAFMLAKWVGGGGHKRPGNTKLSPALVFGHFVLAAVGLVLWIVYVVTGGHGIGWLALVVLIPVVVLGFVMLARWVPTYRGQGTEDVPERSFPVAVVGGHGALAVVTIVLALIALRG